MKNEKAISMSFNWLFAIIVGAIVIFLAIYGVSKIMGFGGQAIDTESAARFAALLDPAETGIASGKYTEFEFQRLDTRVYFDCNAERNKPFGLQTVSFSEVTSKI